MAFGIDDVIGEGMKIINKFIPDPEQAAKAEGEFRNWLSGVDKGQLEVNKVEAGHSSLFVAGWRPFIGWVCGSGFALHIIILPVLNWVLEALGKQQVDLKFDMQTLITVMMGMLGMGGLRTYEKIKGVAREHHGGMLENIPVVGRLMRRNRDD